MMTPDDHVRQASMTTHTYLIEAKRSLDQVFHRGFAQQNPQLLGLLVIASAIDFHTARQESQVEDIVHVMNQMAPSED